MTCLPEGVLHGASEDVDGAFDCGVAIAHCLGDLMLKVLYYILISMNPHAAALALEN